jgi:uncharacterized protein
MNSPIANAVEQIWRYPVKSLRGELIESSIVDARGLLGDRLWAVRDREGKLGSGKNTNRFRRFPGPPLLSLSSRCPVEPTTAPTGIEPPLVIDADGTEYPVHDGSADRFFQREWENPHLTVTRETDVDHFDDGPVSLIGTASLLWVEEQLPGVVTDVRRFRSNLVVRTTEPFEEEAWLGHTVRLGTGHDAVELRFTDRQQRCVMAACEQDDLPEAPGMLKMLAQRPDQPLRLAIVGTATRPGVVRRGDTVSIAD